MIIMENSTEDIIITDGIMEILGNLDMLENIQLDELDAYLNNDNNAQQLPYSPPDSGSESQQSPLAVSSAIKTDLKSLAPSARVSKQLPKMATVNDLSMYSNNNFMSQHLSSHSEQLPSFQMSPPSALSCSQSLQACPVIIEPLQGNMNSSNMVCLSPEYLNLSPQSSQFSDHTLAGDMLPYHVPICSGISHNVLNKFTDSPPQLHDYNGLPSLPSGYSGSSTHKVTGFNKQMYEECQQAAGYLNSATQQLPEYTSSPPQQALSVLPNRIIDAIPHQPLSANTTLGSSTIVTQLNRNGSQINQPVKKRKLSAGSIHVTMGTSQVKSEVMAECSADDIDGYCEPSAPFGEELALIKWQPFKQAEWVGLLDNNMKAIPLPEFHVDADKGFIFSLFDDSFVCQKKNHFQLTIHVDIQQNPSFVLLPSVGVKRVNAYYLHFYGVKMEATSHIVRVEQSQADRRKMPFDPVKVELINNQPIKVTVGRLHFCETTANNMRKKGKPNPDQRYFQLVVALQAHCDNETYIVVAHVSEKIIVRASNPGQFDNESDVLWSKSSGSDAVYHMGPVGINTELPDEALTVHGNMKVTGLIVQPSDQRVKVDIAEVDGKIQLKNISDLKIYKYQYDPAFAATVGMDVNDLSRTGVLAQEVHEVLPDAVKTSGDVTLSNGLVIEQLQVVDKDRIYMENVGAVKELCKVTGDLETRILELEYMNKRLVKARLHRKDSRRSTCSTVSNGSLPSLPSPQHVKDSTIKRQPSDLCRYCHSYKCNHHKDKFRSHLPCNGYFLHIATAVLVLIMAACVISLTTIFLVDRSSPIESNNLHMYDEGQTTANVSTVSPVAHTHEISPSTGNVTNSESLKIETMNSSLTTPHSVFEDEMPVGTLYYNDCKVGNCVRLCCQSKNQCFTAGDSQENASSETSENSAPTYKSSTIAPSYSFVLPNAYSALETSLSVEIFSLPDLKILLDRTYCLTSDCLNSDKSYELSIPVSPNFPAVNNSLLIALPQGFSAALCKQVNNPAYCSISSTVNATQISSSTFNLTFAYYSESTYSIRIGNSELSQELCNQPTTLRRVAYVDYVLIFYRACC